MPIFERTMFGTAVGALILIGTIGSALGQDLAIAPPLDVPLEALEAIADARPDATQQASRPKTLDMFNNSFEFGTGISNSQLLAALEGAADAGQPLALWQLGVIYEDGVGVAPDPARAFSYFSRIANDNADALPSSRVAGIVAQSFLKVGEYYRSGLPDAGISVDSRHARSLVLYAASYFGDPEAQFRAGKLYLEEAGGRANVIQAGRWLGLAARKGHAGAQARLGDLIFNEPAFAGDAVEGLTWLMLAERGGLGTEDEIWIDDLYERDYSIATPQQRASALVAADLITARLGN